MSRAFLALLALVLAVAGVGCPCVKSAINASPELRWFLFSNFGASQICPEMLKRGVPLKLPQLGATSIGRFFPQTCHVQVDDPRKTMVMTVSGTGYVTLPVTRRVGFSITMGVEYAPDFRLADDSVYVWGKFTRFVAQPDMRIVGVENPIVNLATQTPFGTVANIIGSSVVAGEIGRGFTVVRQDDGDDFAIGHLEPPQKPKRQFRPGAGRILLASDITEVRPSSRDYLGPFEISSPGTSLFLRAKVEGNAVAYTIVDRSVGEAWRRAYEAGGAPTPPPGVVLGQGALPAGDMNLRFPLNPGSYYLVVDNTAPATLVPLGVPLPIPEPVAYVTYGVEVGDR
jgi:hypothetical protein